MSFDLPSALGEMTEHEVARYLTYKNGYNYDAIKQQDFSDAQINQTLLGMDEATYQDTVARSRNERMYGDFEKGLIRGGHNVAGAFGAMGAMGGSLLKKAGAERIGQYLQDKGMESYVEHDQAASLYPKDAFSESPVGWAVGTVGEQVPNMALTVAGSLTGGGLAALAGKKAAMTGAKAAVKGAARKKAAAMGMKAGAGAAVFPLETGGMYGELAHEHGQDAPFSAAFFGSLATAMEYIPGGNLGIVDTMFDAAKTGKGRLVKTIAREIAESAPSEAFQEAGQETMAALNVVANTDERLLTGQNLERVLEAAAAGGFMGALGGTAKGITGALRSSGQNKHEAVDILKGEVKKAPPQETFQTQEQGQTPPSAMQGRPNQPRQNITGTVDILQPEKNRQPMEAAQETIQGPIQEPLSEPELGQAAEQPVSAMRGVPFAIPETAPAMDQMYGPMQEPVPEIPSDAVYGPGQEFTEPLYQAEQTPPIYPQMPTQAMAGQPGILAIHPGTYEIPQGVEISVPAQEPEQVWKPPATTDSQAQIQQPALTQTSKTLRRDFPNTIQGKTHTGLRAISDEIVAQTSETNSSNLPQSEQIISAVDSDVKADGKQQNVNVNPTEAQNKTIPTWEALGIQAEQRDDGLSLTGSGIRSLPQSMVEDMGGMFLDRAKKIPGGEIFESSVIFPDITEKESAQIQEKLKQAAFNVQMGNTPESQIFFSKIKGDKLKKLKESKSIQITGKEYESKYQLNRDSAKAYMKKHLRGSYTNKDTGEKINVVRVGINKVTSHDESNIAHLQSIAAIPQLIEDSIFVEERKNEKGNKKYDSFRYYVAGLKIGDVDYTAKVVVGVKGDSKFYDHRLTQIEKGALIDSVDRLAKSDSINENPSSGIKDTRLVSILQDNSSGEQNQHSKRVKSELERPLSKQGVQALESSGRLVVLGSQEEAKATVKELNKSWLSRSWKDKRKELARLIEKFKEEVAGQELSEEQQGIKDVVVGKKSVAKIRKGDLDLVQGYIELEQGKKQKNRGATHILIDHYSGKRGAVTAQEILEVGEVIRKGKIKEADGQKRVYTLYDKGIRFKVIVGERNGKEILITFYSNRKSGLKTGLGHNATRSDKPRRLVSDSALSDAIKSDNDVDVKYSGNGKIQGFTNGNTIYLVADGIKGGHGWNTFVHEAGIHVNKLLLSNKNFELILGNIDRWQHRDDETGRIVREAFAKVPENTNPKYRTEEALAYLVEHHPEMGIVRRFISLVKRLLAQAFGKPFVNMLTPADLRAMAQTAARQMAKDAVTQEKTTSNNVAKQKKSNAKQQNGLPSPAGFLASMADVLGVSRKQLAREYQAVVDRFKGTEQWMKAPNGKRTKLNERQWVLVRTPRFKAWFGNFEVSTDTFEEVSEYIDKALAGKQEKNLVFGKVNSGLAHDIENAAGVNLVGADIELVANDLRHIIKGHGKDSGRQEAVTADHLKAIPYIFSDYDSVRAGAEKDGRKSVILTKKINGIANVVEVIPDKRKKLAVKTMWVKSPGDRPHAQSKNFVPSNTSETAAASGLYKNIKDFLERSKSSKVVDKNGEPLVVYHGSGNIGVTSFSKNKIGSIQRLDWGEGFYFSPLKSDAAYYSSEAMTRKDEIYNMLLDEYLENEDENLIEKIREREEEIYSKNPIIYQAFLNIKKPLVHSGAYGTDPDLLANSGAKSVDGIFIVTKGKLEELVAFSPNQIKSATGNTGAFAPNNPDIRFSVAAEQQYQEDKETFWDSAMDLFKGHLKYRKDKGDGSLPDISPLAHHFGTTMYNAKKVGGGAERAFDVFRKQADWKYEKQRDLLYDGDVHIAGMLNTYRKQNKAGYEKLNRYVVDMDVDAIGHIVREGKNKNGDTEFVLLGLKGEGGRRSLGAYETEDKAWQASWEKEAAMSGLDEQGRDCLKAYRLFARKLYLHYIKDIRDAIESFKKADLPLPEITTIRDGQEVQIDLETLAKEMGDRQGYYFPRLRQSGQYRVFGEKPGRKEHKYFDTRFRANQYRASLDRKGFTTNMTKVGKLSEDIYQALEPLLAMQQTINRTLSKISSKDKERLLSDRNLFTEMRGDTLVLKGSGLTAELEDVLKDIGGKYVDHFTESGNKKTYAPEIHFEKVDEASRKAKTEEITKKVLYAGELFKDMDKQFASAFAKEFDAVLKGRGSRARMIARSDATGENVSRGYEEDLITALSQAGMAAAGGYAKGQVAQKATAAILGRDISWEDYVKEHDDGTIDRLTEELKGLETATPEELNRKKDLQKQVRDLRGKLLKQEFSSLREVENIQGEITRLQREAQGISQYSDKDKAKKIQAKLSAAKTELYESYQNMTRKRGIQADKQQYIYKEITATLKDILRNEEAADRLIGTLKGLAVWQYLGFRVSSAAINMTNMVTGMPAVINGETDDEVSLNSAIRFMGTGMKEYVKSRQKGSRYQELFDEISQRGWDEPKFNREAFTILQSKLGRGWQQTLEWSMLMFGATEKMNRAASIAGTYLAMKAAHARNGKGAWDHEAMMEKAKDITDKGHGVYEKANRPYHMRGDNIGARVLQMAYVFQTFQHNYIQEMWRLFRDKRQAKAAAYMMLSPGIFGVGATLPMGVLKAMVSAFGGDDPEERLIQIVEDNFGGAAGNFTRYGITGIGDHGVSLKGSLAVRFAPPESFMDIFGAAGSVVGDLYSGGQNLVKGHYREAFEQMAPAALGNVSKAIRESTEGVTTRSGRPVFWGEEQLQGDTIDMVIRILSFNPTHIAKKKEIQWNEYKIKDRYKERKADIYKKLRAFYNKPPARRSRADLALIKADIRDFNEEIKRKKIERLVPGITNQSIRQAIRKKPPKQERLRWKNSA